MRLLLQGGSPEFFNNLLIKQFVWALAFAGLIYQQFSDLEAFHADGSGLVLPPATVASSLN